MSKQQRNPKMLSHSPNHSQNNSMKDQFKNQNNEVSNVAKQCDPQLRSIKYSSLTHMHRITLLSFNQQYYQPMGCTDSSSAVPPRTLQHQQPQNYNTKQSTMFYQMQHAKRPKFLSTQELAQSQKDVLWALVQRNSVKEFAYFLETQGIASNVEVGPAGTFWNFAHFCARWDAFECLAYMIKRVYAQKSTLLLSLLNQQTIEGFTALHIAIEWNSLNSFYVLLDHGGLDLSYTDKANNDVFAKANLFKRVEMLQVLERFRAANALMVLVQPEKARGFRDFGQLVAEGQVATRSQYRLTNERIDEIIDTRNKLNRPPPPPPPKQENANKYQDFYNAMKKIQGQKPQNIGENGRETSMGQQQYRQEQATINNRKLQEQKRFQEEQLKAKKAQDEEFKRNMKLQRQEEEKRLLRAEEEKQISKERVFEQAELAKIEKEKQLMRKNIEAMHSTAEAKVNLGKNKMACPEDLKQKYQAALSKGTKFVDTQFPAQEKSLGNVKDFKFGWDNCVWLRPEQMFPGGKFQVFDGISPDDVKQGTLAVCYYLALLASIAQNEHRIKKIFRFYDKELGFYALQFYMQGKPITVVVDDLIPCMRGTKEPLFAKPRSPEVWVMIFEKAWVKLFGSYLAAEKMSPNDMFQNVLPSPCRFLIVDISKIEENFQKLLEFDRKNYIMVTSSVGNRQDTPPGIVDQHAYSLIGVYDINGTKLFKIRNPWGKTEYQGMYSDQSPLWTPELQKAVGFHKGDDGTFFLTPTELQNLMPCVATSLYRDDYEYSYIEVESKSNEDVFFIVNVKTKGELAIKVTQKNERFRKEMEWENCPIRLQVFSLGEGYQAKFVSEGEPETMYEAMCHYSNENMYDDFQPGRYMIRLKVMYDRAQNVSTRGTMRKFIRGTDGKNVLKVMSEKSVLSMYGPERYIFNRITKEQGEKYMRNAFKNAILGQKEPKQRMRSTGQDLKPTVITLDHKMRNHIIYMAQNLFPKHSINFTFEFDHKKFRNCSYAYNINKDTQKCQWLIEPGGWNLCTMEIDCPFQEVATEGELGQNFKIVR